MKSAQAKPATFEQNWKQFKAEFYPALRGEAAKSIIQRCGGEIISPEHHPSAYRQYDQIARACGIKKPETIFLVVDSLAPHSKVLRNAPNVGANPVVDLVVATKSALNALNSNMHGSFSDEFKAVLAHEISHLKDGGAHILDKVTAPIYFPLVAMAGYYLYERATHAQQDKKPDPEEIKAKIADGAEQEKAEFGAMFKDNSMIGFGPSILSKAQVEHSFDLAKYTAVAAVGIAAGLLYSRHQSLSSEFRADRLSVQVMKSAEPLERALVTLSGEWKKIIANKPAPKSFSDYFHRCYEKLMAKTVHAHPTLPERISYIRKVEQEMLAAAHVPHTHAALLDLSSASVTGSSFSL